MHRLLIADSDEVLTMALNKVLSADFEIQSCRDGFSALELLAEFKPHALIINLQLPYMDGLTVLHLTPYTPPVIIAISPVQNPLVVKSCIDAKVSYLMISPCLRSLQLQTVHLVNQWAAGQGKRSLEAQTAEILHQLNAPLRRTGGKQLCTAIPMYYKDRDQCLDTALYKELARIFNKSSGRTVEKSMREAITAIWKNRDPITWQKYFSDPDACPSNKVFFDAIADHLFE